MTDISMTIDGSSVVATDSFGVINPATGSVFAEAPNCSEQLLNEAFRSAQAAFVTWRMDETVRRAALEQAAQAIFAAVDELGAILTAEQGKPLPDAVAEAKGAGVWLKYYSRLELPREVIQDDSRAFAEVKRRPMGVVAAITPWNFPLALATWKIAPALLAGNTMVLKPSPFTPLATLKMGEILAKVLPPGVLNVVAGGDELGRLMTSNPIPRKISFTGSVGAGKQVLSASVADLKRVTLELGGNDAAIILDDADPEKIAGGIFWGAFQNNGQVCSAIKRVYVPEQLYEGFVDALVQKGRSVKVGPGTDDGVRLGPINNKPQFDRVSELVSDAVDRGARVATGGNARPGKGYFYPPTILTDVEDGVRIVDEEQFGPALPILSYTDLDDAVVRANATSFGLSGSVWTADPNRGRRVAESLECGTAWVNSHLVLAPHQPFGGVKWSGIGVENGPWGYYSFTDLQVVHIPKS